MKKVTAFQALWMPMNGSKSIDDASPNSASTVWLTSVSAAASTVAYATKGEGGVEEPILEHDRVAGLTGHATHHDRRIHDARHAEDPAACEAR